MQDETAVAEAFRCLSSEARLQIVRLLSEKSICVNGLAARLQMTQGAVSQHLRILREAGLLVPERRGYRVHYRLNRGTAAIWLEWADRLLAPQPGQLPMFPGPAPTKEGEDQ